MELVFFGGGRLTVVELLSIDLRTQHTRGRLTVMDLLSIDLRTLNDDWLPRAICLPTGATTATTLPAGDYTCSLRRSAKNPSVCSASAVPEAGSSDQTLPPARV